MTQENNQQTTVTRELDAVEVAQAAQTGNNNPEDVAAAFFALEYPRFKAMLQTLSQNELVRLALNLAGNEFVPEANKLKTEKEKTCYYLGNQMIFNRSIMLLTHEMQKVEEAQKLEETQETKTEGETNG